MKKNPPAARFGSVFKKNTENSTRIVEMEILNTHLRGHAESVQNGLNDYFVIFEKQSDDFLLMMLLF